VGLIPVTLNRGPIVLAIINVNTEQYLLHCEFGGIDFGYASLASDYRMRVL